MNKLGFPTIGKVFKLVIEAIGITFNDKSFLSSYHDGNEDLNVGNLSRRVKNLASEKKLDLPKVEELQKLIINPFVVEISKLINFPPSFKPILYKRAIDQLTYPIKMIFELYKGLVTNFTGNNIKLLFYYTKKLAIFTNIITHNTTFKLIRSKSEPINWINDKIVKEDYYTPVFDWWCNITGHKTLHDLTITFDDANENLYKRLLSWKNRENSPTLEKFFELINSIPNNSLDANLKVNLLLKLIVSKALTHLTMNYTPVTNNQKLIDVINHIYCQFKQHTSDFNIVELYSEFETIHIDDPILVLESHSPNEEELYNNINMNLDMARSYIYNYLEEGSFKMANKHYLEAFNLSIYKTGAFTKEIIEEILVAAAFMNDSQLAKKVYSWATVYGLFNEPYSSAKEWILWFYKLEFFKFFDIYEFTDIAFQQMCENKEILKKENIYYGYSFKRYKWSKEDVRNTANDINLLDDYFYLELNQLMKFSFVNCYEKVDEAMKIGARLDIKNQDNGTALYYALIAGNFEISLLLLKSGKKIDINTITYKDKSSYFDALLQGLFTNNSELAIDVLKELLDKGFDLNHKTSIYASTPIYTLTKLAFFRPETYDHSISNPSYEDLAIRDYESINNANSIFGDNCKNEYQNIVQNGYSERTIETKIKLNPIYFKMLDLILSNNDTNYDILSKSKFSPLLYLSRVGTLEYFEKVYARTNNKYYCIKGEKIEKHESIVKNCIQNKNWDILNYYMDNIDIRSLVYSDKYLPCFLLYILDRYIHDPNNTILKNILFRFGTYFLLVTKAFYSTDIAMKSPELLESPELQSIYINDMIKMKSMTFESLPQEDFETLINSILNTQQ